MIFGGPNNPTTDLASLVNEILNPFVTQVKSVVKDSVDFINRMPVFAEKDLPYIQMWSVDIKDMYPSINHSLGLEALKFWLEKFPNLLPSRFSVQFILEAMFFILENNVGYFNGDYYKQVVGTATGIKPAPPYANLTIGYLEIKLFFKLNAKFGSKIANYFWDVYRRFLDDGQIMWDIRLGNFLEVLEVMNSLDPMIKFTYESSKEKLIFLDIVITKTQKASKLRFIKKKPMRPLIYRLKVVIQGTQKLMYLLTLQDE